MEAGRLMLERIDDLMKQKKSFAFESTPSTRSFKQYFWLNSPKLAIQRVQDRVSKGRHKAPTEIIVRRYNRSIQSLRKLYTPIVNRWVLYDNSGFQANLIADNYNVYNSEVWGQIQS